jgi:hypothetical protein
MILKPKICYLVQNSGYTKRLEIHHPFGLTLSLSLLSPPNVKDQPRRPYRRKSGIMVSETKIATQRTDRPGVGHKGDVNK